MSQNCWIPDPCLVQLLTLRGQYEDLDVTLTDFDSTYKSGHHLGFVELRTSRRGMHNTCPHGHDEESYHEAFIS